MTQAQQQQQAGKAQAWPWIGGQESFGSLALAVEPNWALGWALVAALYRHSNATGESLSLTSGLATWSVSGAALSLHWVLGVAAFES